MTTTIWTPTFFTPFSLFVLVNITILTIFLTSRFLAPKNSQTRQLTLNQPQLGRTSSRLQRVKSINFSFNDHLPVVSYQQDPSDSLQKHGPDDQYPSSQPESKLLSRAPSFLERVKLLCRLDSGNLDPETDTPPLETDPGHEAEPKLSEKVMKTSSSENSRRKEESEEEVERRRPQTARIERTRSFGEGGDQGVDAKADDFINWFKQQLRLQRLDSLRRYRGSTSA